MRASEPLAAQTATQRVPARIESLPLESPDGTSRTPTPRLRRLAGPLIFLLSFLTFAPSLAWVDFHNSIENIVVATALETRREGHWMVPRLQGEPRTRKPPLAVWVSAPAVRPSTVERMSSTDPPTRAWAYERFAFEVRWTALAASCLMLVATFELGRVIAGVRVGLIAAVVAATSLLFLKCARLATPDTQLALWVAVTNVFLARAILLRERWIGSLGAGAALGLAMMSKGPVSLVQSLLPALLFVGLHAWSARRRPDDDANVDRDVPTSDSVGATARHSWLLPVLAGVALTLLISLPWYAWMAFNIPGIWETWFREATRTDPADPRPDKWYANFLFFYLMLPWTLWLVLGAASGVAAIWKRRAHHPMVFPLLLVLVPLIIQSFFSERKDRYLQPLIPAAAVICAWAIEQHLLTWGMRRLARPAGDSIRGFEVVNPSLHPVAVSSANDSRPRSPAATDLFVAGLHWFIVAGLTIGVSAGRGWWQYAIDGSPLYPRGLAAASIALFVALTLIGLLFHLRRHRPLAIVPFTCAAMLAYDVLARFTDSRGSSGQADLKPLAREIIHTQPPDAPVFGFHPEGKSVPHSLSIYLNRQVRKLASLSELPPPPTSGDSPQILVLAVRGRGAQPPRLSPEWRLFATERRGDSHWHAFVRGSTSARPGGPLNP